MLAGDLANPGEEALGGRTAAGVGADAAGPRPETILVIPAHRHRSRWSMQKHNKLFLGAAKSRANIDVSQRRRHCAAFWTVPRAVSQPVCRPRYLRAMARDGAIRFNLALRPSHCLRPPAYRCLENHRFKICTPDRSRRSVRGTAGSPREEQRCAAQHVARMPIMRRFEPGEIGNRTCAQSTVGLQPMCG